MLGSVRDNLDRVEGMILRVTESQGRYTAGVRLPEDNEVIKRYVDEKMHD